MGLFKKATRIGQIQSDHELDFFLDQLMILCVDRQEDYQGRSSSTNTRMPLMLLYDASFTSLIAA